MRIFTIGYEKATVAEFLAALQQAGVERLIDVRALPLSHRPNFSKTPLKAALHEIGVEYLHLRALGTAADGRAAARAGRHGDLVRIYAGQLELPEAIAQNAMMLERPPKSHRRCSASSATQRSATARCCSRRWRPKPRSSICSPSG